ncbi:hypothetical protein JCM33374_g1765 [Metschnikowia sp. JCM 33374]|nr:hypothetical protein JCM33374_g1765 [Metschnikowia sp. JCM 33374]
MLPQLFLRTTVTYCYLVIATPNYEGEGDLSKGFFSKEYEKTNDLSTNDSGILPGQVLSEHDYSFAKTERLVEFFVEDIMAYVTYQKFDFLEFEGQIDSFRKEIYHLEFSIETGLHYEELAQSLSFAKHVFQTMVDSTEKLMLYTGCILPGHDYLQNVIELNVLIFVCYNLHGGINTHYAGFETKVYLFFRKLSIWEDEMRAIDNVPVGMRHLFKKLVTSAKKTLESLELSLPQ